ncbi:hypothetical protein B0H15DRAFT_1024163 [Mycena belliarum]|uniref:Uncharacterized protein n=1 Tax=Mycena belliarum TaxID=1033014 RepID=A0AAD6TY76_9AGAR|nr:hypothetical protein B0H15DRAFT_1024163 [Mycena belliae]
MARRWDNPSPDRRHVAASSSFNFPSSTSSPIFSPEDEDDEALATPNFSSPSEDHSHNPRKRTAADMTQLAEQTGRNLRLKLSSVEALQGYSTMSAPEQSIWLAGQMLLQTELLQGLQAPEAMYHIPAALEGYIAQYSFLVLIDAHASAYVTKGKAGPFDRLLAYLTKLPDSGLTAAIVRDKSKFDTVKARMRQKLTHNRNAIKDLLADSFGDTSVDPEDPAFRPTNIVDLCQQIVALGAHRQPAELKVSLEMCARFAFVRESYVALVKDSTTGKPVDFWKELDKDLGRMREAKNNDPVRISQLLSDSLADDRRKYGPVSVDDLLKVSPISLD